MSRNTRTRRREAQRFGVVVLGAAAALAGTGAAAVAAPGVIIPLAPGEVLLSAFPVENFGAMDPMADPNAAPDPTPVDVRFGGTITVDLPAELDASAVEAELGFDDDGDGTPDVTYSSSLASDDPFHLAITGEDTGNVVITLPDDNGPGVDTAVLLLEPLGTNLGSAYTHLDPLFYDLNFDAAAPAAVTVEPLLVAVSQEPCDISSATRCAFPTPVTAGSMVTLDLTSGSVLRELGIANLTGVQVGLQRLDANGAPVGAPVLLATQVTGTGSTADVTIPAGTAAGSYGLVIASEAPSGAVSIVAVELTVVAAVTPAAAPTTAVNAGLRSNTGVENVETGSTGNVAITMGAGLLVLAGAGGIAVARTRRRPSVEGGPCGV